jgi:chondroitin AC lyase
MNKNMNSRPVFTKAAPLTASMLSLLLLTACADSTMNSTMDSNKASLQAEPLRQVQPNQEHAKQFSAISQLKLGIVPDLVKAEQKRQQQASLILTDAASKLLQQQDKAGSWPDIYYKDTAITAWLPEAHLLRLKTLAAAYYILAVERTSDSSSANNDTLVALANGIEQGLAHWYAVKPESKNWWWNQIGKQMHLGAIGLMAEPAISIQMRQTIADDLPKTPSSEGANLTDFAKIVIYGGLLSDDKARVAAGLDGIKASVKVTQGEGIQADLSFHQHGAQLHNGSYGKVFFNTVIYWAYQVKDSPWAFSKEQTDLLISYFLESDRWMTRAGTIDYSTAGRSVSRSHREFSNKTILLKQLEYISALVPQREEELAAFREHINGGGSGLNGHKHFWRSDYAVTMRDDYHFSVKMASKRVATTESGNGENLLGYWLGFGNTFLRQRGDEYQDIFPVWDWRYLPGVTAPEYEGLGGAWGKHLHQSTFVGGVSNGLYGVTAMDLNVMDITAKKAWFHFADEIVALGAGINANSGDSKDKRIHTTVNQTVSNGRVIIDGKELKQAQQSIENATWLHHDNVGYVFALPWQGQVSQQAKTGSWQRINNSQNSDLLTKDVFLLKISHGNKVSDGQYQYTLLPAKTVAQTQQYAKSPAVEILQNNSSIQAVYHKGLNTSGMVFYQAGTTELASGLVLSVDKPCIVLLEEKHQQVVVSVSVPDVLAQRVEVNLAYPNQNIVKETFVMPTTVDTLGMSITKIIPIK